MNIKVTVKDGVTVRHPATGVPIKNGQSVRKTPQIRRLLRDGDLLTAPETVATPKKKTETATKKEA